MDNNPAFLPTSINNALPVADNASGVSGGDASVMDVNSSSEISQLLSMEDQAAIIKQVQAEYLFSDAFLKPKREEWGKRLKLYNNQRRDKEAIGDPLLFTIFQTILAILYDDTLTVEWAGRDEGDDEQAENLNALAAFDFEDMEKDVADYERLWDAMFFGRAVQYMVEWDRRPDENVFTPMPETVDIMTFFRDPRAVSINGDKQGRNSCRFFGRFIWLTKPEMSDNENYKDISSIRQGYSIKDTVLLARQFRSDAQNLQNMKLLQRNDLGANNEFALLEWFTTYRPVPTEANPRPRAKKIMVTLANEGLKIVRYQEIPFKKWPVIDTPLYPTAHDWDGASIPDFVEDKQRARSVIQNLQLAGLKSKMHPMYLFNEQMIKNKGDLNWDFDKWVPIKGDVRGAVAPMERADLASAEVSFILETLDVASQRATATPEVQQGIVSQEKRTLGEINLVANKATSRTSLALRILGWSERRFWQHWYQMYKEYFDSDVDKKIIRIEGSFGPEWRPLGKADLITEIDPDCTIVSKVSNDQDQLSKRELFLQLLTSVGQAPGTNLRYGFRKLAKLSGEKKDEIDRLMPPTIDELVAEDENKELNQGHVQRVIATQDHVQHLEMHAAAKDTNEAKAHIAAHRRALELMKNPNLAPAFGQQTANNTPEQNGAPTPTATPTTTGAIPLAPQGLPDLSGRTNFNVNEPQPPVANQA